MIVNNVTGYAGAVSLSSADGDGAPGQQHDREQRQHGDHPAGGQTRPNVPPTRTPQVAGLALLSGRDPDAAEQHHLGQPLVHLPDRQAPRAPSGYGRVQPVRTTMPRPTGPGRVVPRSRTARAAQPRAALQRAVDWRREPQCRRQARPTSLPRRDQHDAVVKKNEFLSIIGADATVKSCRISPDRCNRRLTVDESGNFVNVIFSPLTLWELSGDHAGDAARRLSHHRRDRRR